MTHQAAERNDAAPGAPPFKERAAQLLDFRRELHMLYLPHLPRHALVHERLLKKPGF